MLGRLWMLSLVLCASCGTAIPIGATDASAANATDDVDLGLADAGPDVAFTPDIPAPDAVSPDACTSNCACGNGVCDAEETVTLCPADCAFLAAHTAGSCSQPGSWNGCPWGYICAGRSKAGGGNVCVADFDTWGVLPDARAASEYVDFGWSVTDSLTGLEWAKEALPPMPWAVALSACTTQTIGGHTDWRLPSNAELRTLLDYAKEFPAATAPGLSWPPNCITGVTDYSTWCGDPYWSDVPGPTWKSAWELDFADASNLPSDPTATWHVRCVRGAASGAKSQGVGARFAATDQGQVVLDRVTGLRWQIGESVGWIAHAAAETWCATNAAAAPGEGWRLPSIRELTSIVDRRLTQPAIDPIFGTTQYFPHWSTSLVARSYGDGTPLPCWLMVEFAVGFSDLACGSSVARCVR